VNSAIGRSSLTSALTIWSNTGCDCWFSSALASSSSRSKTIASPRHLFLCVLVGLLGLFVFANTSLPFFYCPVTMSLSVRVRYRLRPCAMFKGICWRANRQQVFGCGTGSSVNVSGWGLIRVRRFLRDFRFMVVPHLGHCIPSTSFHVQLIPDCFMLPLGSTLHVEAPRRSLSSLKVVVWWRHLCLTAPSRCSGHLTGMSESSRHPSPFCSMIVQKVPQPSKPLGQRPGRRP